MTASTHFADFTREIAMCGKSVELVARIKFKYQPGEPEQGPSYASGGQPAEPASCEVLGLYRLTINGDARKSLECPAWLSELIIADLTDDELFEAAKEDLEASEA
jgi:hypothetical protein